MTEERKESQVRQTVPMEVYERLENELKTIRGELDLYRQKSPLVGVRWFGRGIFHIKLTHPIGGVNMHTLKGYKDKAVVDHATWTRIKNTVPYKEGVLVRDDDVITELDYKGVTAPPDKVHSPNGFTDKEVDAILKGKPTELKKILSEMTSHWGPIHLLERAEEINLRDKNKVQAITQRKNYLLLKYRCDQFLDHDIVQIAETYNINHDNRSREEVVEDIIKHELETNDNIA